MSEARFAARVTPKGELVFADEPAWRHTLRRWIGRDLMVTLALPRRDRTNRQNRWYRGAIVTAVAEELSRGRELPISNDQAHHVLKGAFIGIEQTPLGPAPRSTKNLSTVEFSNYCEEIRAHAASEWGRNIPSPEEWERSHGTGGWEQRP